MASNEQARRKGRGRAKFNFMKMQQPGQKFHVDISSAFQPTGPHSANLARFIGSIARDGNQFPLTALSFSEFRKKPVLQKTISEVKDVFELSSCDSNPYGVDDWIVEKLSGLWRSYKAKVKKNYFTPYATDDLDEDLKIPRPPEIDEDVWQALVAYWSTNDAKEMSERNKVSRAKKKLNHKGGSKSFANYFVELEKVLERPPTRKEIFAKMYLDQGHTEEGEAAELAKLMEEKEELIRPGLCDFSSEDLDENGPGDEFSMVMGDDEREQLRYLGKSAKRKKCCSDKSCSSTEVLKLRKENASFKAEVGVLTELVKQTMDRLHRLERTQRSVNIDRTRSSDEEETSLDTERDSQR